METNTKVLHTEDSCSLPEKNSVISDEMEELTLLQRNDRIEFLKQQQEVLKEKLNIQTSITKVDGSITTSILQINDLNISNNSLLNKSTTNKTASSNDLANPTHSAESEENSLSNNNTGSKGMISITPLNPISSGKINILPLKKPVSLKGKKTLKTNINENSKSPASHGNISLKDYVSKLPEYISKSKEIAKTLGKQRCGLSIKKPITIDLTEIEDNECEKKIFSVSNDQLFIKNNKSRLYDSSNLVRNEDLIVNSLKHTIGTSSTPRATIMSSNALQSLSSNKQLKIPISISLPQYTNAISSSKRPSSLPIKRIYSSTNTMNPSSLLNIGCEVTVGSSLTKNTICLSPGFASLVSSNINIQSKSTVKQATSNVNMHAETVKSVDSGEVATVCTSNPVTITSNTNSNSDDNINIITKELRMPPLAAIKVPTHKPNFEMVKNGATNVHGTININKKHLEASVTKSDLKIYDTNTITTPSSASNTSVPSVQCVHSEPSSLPVVSISSSSIVNTTTKQFYTVRGVTSGNLTKTTSSKLPLKLIVQKSEINPKTILTYHTPVGNVKPIVRNRSEIKNLNVNKSEVKTHVLTPGKPHVVTSGKPHAVLSSNKSDIVLTPELIHSLSTVLKTKQNKSLNVSNSQLVYGQISMLPNTSGNKTNQPVLFIQSPSSGVRKVMPIESPNTNTTTTTQMFVQKMTIPTTFSSNSNQFFQLFPVTIPSTVPLSNSSAISLQGMMIMNVNKTNANSSSTETMVTSVCNKPLVLTISNPSNLNSSSVDVDASKKLCNVNLPDGNLPKKSDTQTTQSSCSLVSTLSNSVNSLASFVKQASFQSSCGKTKNIAQVQPYTMDHQSKVYDNVNNSRFSEVETIPLSQATSSTLSITTTTDTRLIRDEEKQKTAIEKSNQNNVRIDSGFLKSPNKITFNKQSTEIFKKHLIPIHETGSARTNGLKPYKRVDTVLFDTMTGLISPINSPSQYPVISEYKSLAVSASSNTNTILTTLKSHIWRSVQSPADAAILGTQTVFTTKNNSGVPKRYPSEVCLTSIKTEVVDLTEEPSENLNLNSKSSNEKETGSITLRDTIGILRSDQDLPSTKAKYNIKDTDTVGVVRTDKLVIEEVICNNSKNEEVLKSPPAIIIHKEVNNTPKIDDIENINKNKEENKKIVEKTTNSNDVINVNPLEENSSQVKEINQTNKIDKVPTTGHVNLSSKNNSSNSFHKISRTFFSLDRLYLNRKRWEGHATTALVIDSLRELRDELIVERSKQKKFLEKNLTRWKVNVKIPSNVDYIRDKEVSTKSPAQRLLEKFSLSSIIYPTPVCQEKVDNEPKKDHLPSDNGKTGNKPSKDRPKTFNEILQEQRRRKEAKQKENIPKVTSTLENTTTVTSQSALQSTQKVTSPIYASKTLPEKRKTFADVVEEQKKRKDVRKYGRDVVATSPNQDQNKQIPVKESPVRKPTIAFANQTQNKLNITPSSVTSKNSKISNTIKNVIPTSKSPNTIKNAVSTSKSTSKAPSTVKDVISSSKSQQFIDIDTPFRTRKLRKYSNPKDPLNSAEDRALQHALALSLKFANREKTNTKQIGVGNKNKIHVPAKRKLGLNKRIKIERAVISPTPKKKRTSEIDKLVDCHWNESWLKQDAKRNARSQKSIREERALHYAMSRFAEMEYEEEKCLSSKTTSPSDDKNISPDNKRLNEAVEKVRKEKKAVHYKQSSTKKFLCLSKTSKTNLSSKGKDKKAKVAKVQKKLLTSSKQKKNELVKKAMRHFALGKSKSSLSASHFTSTTISTTPNLVLERLPLDSTLESNKDLQVIPAKKKYILVPKYMGFKDFTPIIISSRTRAQATSDDHDKFKKQEFPLMYIEKVGKASKNIIASEEEEVEEVSEVLEVKPPQLESTPVCKNKIVQVCRNTGETILHKASRLGYADVAESNIKSGSDIHVRDNAGWSALHEACAYGKVEVAKVLLKYGADPNCVSDTGIRPLHDAVEKMDIQMIRTLLSYGADPSIASYKGFLPIDCTKNPQVRKLLEGYNADMQACLGKPCRKEDYWTFSGSCDILDGEGHLDIFMDVPTEKSQTFFEIEMSNRPMLTSYYLPHTDDEKVVIGYRNYFILSEILERVNMSRNTFLKKHNVDLLKLSHTDFIQYLENSDVTQLPDLFSSTSKSNNEVELVFIGSQPLRKILNLKTIKIDY